MTVKAPFWAADTTYVGHLNLKSIRAIKNAWQESDPHPYGAGGPIGCDSRRAKLSKFAKNQ